MYDLNGSTQQRPEKQARLPEMESNSNRRGTDQKLIIDSQICKSIHIDSMKL